MELKDCPWWKEACYVNGEWVGAKNGTTINVLDPSDDSVIGTVPNMGREEAEEAIAAAKKAWPAWRALPAKKRGEYLRRWHDLILENVDALALILTREQGKPLAEAKVEVASAATFLDWAAEECRRTYGETIPCIVPGKQAITFKQSIGVAAAITPWNFPFNLVTRKAAPALAAGCPVVVKPASATPYTALSLAALAEKAGLPAGVFNVVTGSSSKIGEAFMKSNDVRAFSFTGSTEVGKKLLAQCADTVKKTAMELGGNAPFIVYDDADFDLATTSAHAAKSRNSGQICVCPNRFFIQRPIYEAFAARVVELSKTIRMGKGTEEGVTQGPLIDHNAVEHMEALVADAVSKGARVLAGGKSVPEMGPNFFQYTILADVTKEMRVYNEEIFGPIMSLIPFDTEEEVIECANDTEYGLASYVFSKDLGRIWRTASAVESGVVGLNEIAVGLGEVPFGGMKESGIGREGGAEGLTEYMETKSFLMGNLSA